MLDLVINRVPQPIRDAITKKSGRLILLHEVDDPAGYVRAWSGVGTLSFDGHDWLGFGDLVSFDGLGGSRKTEVRVVTVTLGGVRTSQLKFIRNRLRGRIGRLSFAALWPDRKAVNGEAFAICAGIIDTQDQKIETSRQSSIILTVNQPLFILDRAVNLAWTPDWLKAAYGDDIVGLDDLPGVAARTVSWTKAD